MNMRDLISLVENDFDDEDEGKSFAHLPASSALNALRPAMVAAAQNQYNSWEQDEDGYDEEVGHGGICHLIADDLAEILGNAGFPCWTQTASDVQHVTCVIQASDGIFDIDIPYRLYERGSMFTWTKLPDVVFDPTDVIVYKMSSYPGEIAQYIEGYEEPEED
jgi:hypothetical protein